MSWTHSTLMEENFTAPWVAIERAVDQCIEVHGFDACSQLLDGSRCFHAGCQAIPSQSSPNTKTVSFTTQIELLYGSEDDTLSSTVLTHHQMQTWMNKPWTLNAQNVAVVEPLSILAVSIPTVDPYTGVSHSLSVASAAANPQEPGGHLSDTTLPDQNPTPPDRAHYDMQSSWHIQLRIDWRDTAVSDDPQEGRILRIKTWFLHHRDDTRCSHPRIVTLDRMDHLWLSDIREVWADKLRAGEALHIEYVRPQPPHADDQPSMPHVILTQGLSPDQYGILLTARFLEEHRTQMLQEAVISPTWLCGTRAVDLLRISHVVQGKRWIARSGIIFMAENELEPIANGISIEIDVRVPSADTDVVSFAAWTRRDYSPDQPLFELPHVAQQEDQLEVEASESDSSDDPDQRHHDLDWRFVHVYRTHRRVYHGYLPWNDASIFQSRVAQFTEVHEDDIAYCHHVRHRPSDLQAAHTEVLLMQSVADLPIGSVHRLVLVDVEFHEHLPATDVSTSRRCLSLPHLTQRRTLFRLLGLEIYCDKVRSRCMMWLNNVLVKAQQQQSFYLEHGDYLKIALPPWPRAAASTSTRTCVSRTRSASRRHGRSSSTPSLANSHEAGMTDVDEYERRQGPSQIHRHDAADRVALLQVDVVKLKFAPEMPNGMLAADVAQTCKLVDSTADMDSPVDKVDDEPVARLQQARSQAAGADPLQVIVNGLPVFVQELFDLRLQHQQQVGDQVTPHAFVETWFSDHIRRPHSGLGRTVRLDADPRSWYTAIVMAWEDHIDPFHDLLCQVVQPFPEGGDPDVVAHVILIQNARPHHSSVLVSITDTAEDPWHPRLLCFVVEDAHVHRDLLRLADPQQDCAQTSTRIQCRTWRGDEELTNDPNDPVTHGNAIHFTIQRDLPWHAADPNTIHGDDDAHDGLHFLQKSVRRHRLQLSELLADVASPVWVTIDCHKALFLREQLLHWMHLQPCLDRSDVQWHPATAQRLAQTLTWTTEMPLGFSFYTDGSATRKSPTATAAVVLIVHTTDGERWGGYLNAECLGEHTAPRAEATALFLALRWCCQMYFQFPSAKPWVEFAFDCQHVAGVAQGKLGGHHNADLLIPIRALLHWLEHWLTIDFHWTHLNSHQGHPWNEAADTLCHHGRKHSVVQNDMKAFHQQCTFDGQDLVPIQWLWLLEKSLRCDVDAPLLHDFHWRFNIAQPLTSLPQISQQPIAQRRDAQPQGPREVTNIKLQFATANVLTLFPGQHYASTYISARAEQLDRQFHDLGVHFIGLQETRSRQDGHHRLQHYHVLSAPASQRGVGGVQLWVHNHISDGHAQLEVDTSHLHILHATTQRLVVRLSCQGLRLIMLVLHAPVDTDEKALHQFWHATSMAIPRQYRSWRLFVLADANSRVGSVCSDAIGDWQPDPENVKGAHFHQWLLEQNLFLPQTLAACHSGPGCTWTHATGNEARLDYIACPQDLRDEAVETWIDERIDLTISREDHACVRAQVPLSFHAVHVVKHRKSQTSLPQLQWPEWKTDVHSHAAAIQLWMRHQQQIPKTLRKSHLTADTAKMIQAKQFHRHCLAKVRRHRRDALLRHIFESWRDDRTHHPNLHPWLCRCDVQEATHLQAFYDLAPRVVQAVRQDDAAFYESLAEQAGSESMKGSRQLWQAIKFTLPKWRAKQRSNLRCTGPTVEEKAAHYNQLEAGCTIPFDELLLSCWTHQQKNMYDAPLCVPMHELPTRATVEHLCATLKTNKAPGIDAISPNTLKAQGLPLAAEITSLFLKMWTTGTEPWQWKGGLVHTIGKKKKSHHIADMRGIALIDVLGKLSHAVMRMQLMPALHVAREPLQLGGFAHQSTMFATHYLRAFEQVASSHHMSSCVLFLDIKSAFHSLVREIVFDMQPVLPERLQQVLTDAGCDPLEVMRHCSQDRIEFQFSPTLARLLSDAHTHTWYTLAASDEVHHTMRGSRPGSPLADAAYNALMTAIIKDIQKALDARPLFVQAHCQLGMRPRIVAWVDDLALPLIFPTAETLVEETAVVMHEVDNICRSYGLVLNMKPKKTEAVVAFRGPQAAEHRHRCFGERQGVLCPDLPAGPLYCVPHYEHLGTIFVAEGKIDAEVSHRLSRAQHAYLQVRKPILANKHIPTPTRLKLLEGLVMPVLFHGSGNWPLLPHRQLQKIHGVSEFT